MKDKNVPNKNLISMLFIFIFLVTSSVFAVWIPVGIGGGGAQYAPSISPIDPNIRFVGSDMKGWYRTGDGGASWNMVDFYQLLTDVDYGWNNGFKIIAVDRFVGNAVTICPHGQPFLRVGGPSGAPSGPASSSVSTSAAGFFGACFGGGA